MDTPHSSKRHRKRDSDLLAEVPDHAVQLDSEQLSGSGTDSLYSRIVLGPLTMISFLLSLCVVDSQQRAWRVAQRSDSEPWPWWKKLSPWTWWNAEPYQSPHDTTWQHAVPATISSDDGADGTVPAPAVDTAHWHTRKKHRKMAKLTVSDAIDMREGMAKTLVTAGLLGMFCVVWLAKHIFFPPA
ncbi:hypothetical protein E4T42_09448 [Aureobasidium subglaciale]|nr:hypothetical protein E4T42_09448 [Aureobasidium subglaciale]